MKLAEQTCRPKKAGDPPLSGTEVEAMLWQVPDWTLGENAIVRDFRFKDFRQAMDFVNSVAAIANEQDHHPDIFISYNKVGLTLSTHRIGGLSMNDFIVAAKIDLWADQKQSEKAA